MYILKENAHFPTYHHTYQDKFSAINLSSENIPNIWLVQWCSGVGVLKTKAKVNVHLTPSSGVAICIIPVTINSCLVM